MQIIRNFYETYALWTACDWNKQRKSKKIRAKLKRYHIPKAVRQKRLPPREGNKKKKEKEKKNPTITSERVPPDCNESHYVSVVCISVYMLTCSNYRWLRSVLIRRSRERRAPKMIWLASGDGAFSCVSPPYNTHDTSSSVGKGPGHRNILI